MRLFISHFEQLYQIHINVFHSFIVLCTEIIILLHHMDTFFMNVTVWDFVYIS